LNEEEREGGEEKLIGASILPISVNNIIKFNKRR
jgi:hypothetical protein